ncbi:Rieske 2Fe-2S domain-containing protein [Corynebacterium sp. H128]|uniref:Rieske (2Fe-2S) protein n=1 Tax=unclassified Corynebacterium TaxID=2624378 RepID=UPI0030B1A573
MFLVATATTFAGAVLAACGQGKGKVEGIAASDVPVGSAIEIDGFIIAQPTAGSYRAYSATCPHQGALIEKFHEGTAICTKHNSVFKLEDGSPISGPSRGALMPAKLSAEGTQLSVQK